MSCIYKCTYLDVRSTPSEHVVVLDQLTQLRKVPAVPLTDSHSERVEVFVELVQQADALDDHVVRPCGVHLHLLDSTRNSGTSECNQVKVLSDFSEPGAYDDIDIPDIKGR